MEFLILGPLQVLDQGRILPLGGAKQRSTLAILLLGRNHVVSREQLIDGLWGESPPPSAGPTLETYVSRLRRVLPDDGHGPRLVTQPPGYRLRVEAGELDEEGFETLLERARKAQAIDDLETAGNDLRLALSLIRGAALEDLAHVPFAREEVARLDELRLVALQLRLDVDLALGRHGEVVGELESLAIRNPFRETLWRQLMLALYRSGRQGEALNVFDRVRRILAEELGLEPSETLKQLHRQILQQDLSLDPGTPSSTALKEVARTTRSAPASPTTLSVEASDALTSKPQTVEQPPITPSIPEEGVHPRRVPLRSRAFIVGAVLSLLAAVAAVVIPRALRGEASTTTAIRPGTALINLDTGKAVTSIPLSRLAVSAYPIFANGHFWVNNFSPGSYVEINPKTGRILKQVNPPAWPVDVPEDSATLSPFAVQGNTLWVGSGHDLVEMDIDLGRVVERFPLDDYAGGGSGIAEGVTVGGGSVWVSRDVGRGQIVRLDPVTGKVQQRFNNMTPYLQLAYGDGSVWAADEHGVARIDAETNTVTRARGIQGNTWVAAGGGFGWTSDSRRGVVYKVDETGHLVETYTTGLGASFMSYTDGVLWVGNRDEGTVTGIDAVTGNQTTYRFSHPAETIAAGGGVLLVYVVRGQTEEKLINSIPGTVAKFFADKGQLGQGDEPALNTHTGAIQVDYATCAMLLNYSDRLAPQRWRLRPEVAATMPTVSPDRRTYTFTVRPGYKFSPPSNQPVTAETFRYSIERALSPKLAHNPTGQTPPGPQYIDDIAGERAFRRGRADHISGLRANGDRLSITLTHPSPDFLQRLALPFFCPVPRGTPFVAGAPAQGDRGRGGHIVSAGPYYVVKYSNEYHVILKRNPNYSGPRSASFDRIAILEGVGASIALDWIERRGWDGITNLSDPLLDLGGVVDRRWGPGSAAADRGDQRYFASPLPRTRFVAFNAGQGLFADPRIRRAAALALDRSALAAAWRQVPTDQILSPVLPGYQGRDLYPLRTSLSKARALMHGRKGRAVMAVRLGCDPCSEAAHVVQGNLAAIGIAVHIRKVGFAAKLSAAPGTFDLVDAETGIPYPDSASFLSQLLKNIPSGWVPSRARAKIRRVAGLSGTSRQTAAAALADHLTTNEVPVAAYATPHISQFIGPRIGCRTFTPFRYGLDLAALCAKGSSG